MRGTLVERFWAKVDVREPYACWEWTAWRDIGGYGRLSRGWRGGGMVAAHHVSWEIHNGPLPDGLVVRHRCDNPACVNPAHLLLGTLKDNTGDALERGRFSLGARQYMAKLTPHAVRTIRKLDRMSARTLAQFFGVSVGVVHRARRADIWKHIPMPERRAS